MICAVMMKGEWAHGKEVLYFRLSYSNAYCAPLLGAFEATPASA